MEAATVVATEVDTEAATVVDTEAATVVATVVATGTRKAMEVTAADIDLLQD